MYMKNVMYKIIVGCYIVAALVLVTACNDSLDIQQAYPFSIFAYHIGAAYSVYTKNANRWVIGGEYLHKKYDYKDMQIPVEQFTAEGGYYLKFLSDRRKTFFLSLGLSALAGYETSNRSEKLLPDGSTLLDKDCFIYGGALTLELETYLTDRVVLLVNARERMLFGSDIGKFHTQVGMGLKFIIN